MARSTLDLPRADADLRESFLRGSLCLGATWRRGGLGVLLLGVAMALVACAPAEPPPEVAAPEKMEEIEPQLREYLQGYIDRTRESPRDPARHAELGRVYAANDMWAEALRCFETTVRFSPEDPLPRYYLAMATMRMGDPQKALALYRETTRRFPGFAPAHEREGSLLLDMGDFDGAEAAFRRVVEADPQAMQGYLGLGDVANRRKNYAKALEYLLRAVQMAPGDRTAHYLLGLALRGLGRDEEARRELALGLNAQRSPIMDDWFVDMFRHQKQVAAQIRYAGAVLQQGRADQAVAILEEVYRWHPDDIWIMNNLALSYIRLKRSAEARALLARALEVEPEHFLTQLNLAECALAEGRVSEALEHADLAIRYSPTTAQAHVTRALCLLRLQPPRIAEARDALETASANDPWNADTMTKLAVVRRNLGEKREAQETFRKAIGLSPAFLPAWIGLSEVSIDLGDRDEARRALGEVRRLAPNDPRVAILEKRIGP